MNQRARRHLPIEQFGTFTIHECLGVGGMATVHRAERDMGMGLAQEIALKRLLPQLANDRVFVDDFVREAKLAARLEHPNIVRTLDLGLYDGQHYIVMELVRGWSLHKLLSRACAAGARAPVDVVLSLMSELLDALAYVSTTTDEHGHPMHVVHRDISPSNLIVTESGNLKVIDFGVATASVGEFATDSGLVKGKLAYMAPEAIADPDRIDARADIFSAGVVAWEMLTGRSLRDPMSSMVEPIRAPSQLDPTCPRSLDRVVMTALAPARERRWQSAAAMRDALDAIRFARRAPTPNAVAQWTRRTSELRDDNACDARPTRRDGVRAFRSSAVTRRQARA